MSKFTTDDFIRRALEIHGNRYDYSKTKYVNAKTKVIVTCPEHGDFETTHSNHLGNKRGCPKCGIKKNATARTLSQEEVVARIKQIQPSLDLSKFAYSGMNSKSTFICQVHGEFQMTPAKILAGQKCPKCIGLYRTTGEFIQLAKQIHGDRYDYSCVDYKNSTTPVTIICPKHGKFSMKPCVHLSNKSGCPKCGTGLLSIYEFLSVASTDKIRSNYSYPGLNFSSMSDVIAIGCPEHGIFYQTVSQHLKAGIPCPVCRKRESFLTQDIFIDKLKKIHGDKYTYDKVQYKGCSEKVTITCKKHGDFCALAGNLLQGHGCPKCAVTQSNGEKELIDFIRSITDDVITGDRTILNGKELDIYIPSRNLAVEFDGLKWHSTEFKDKNYHLNKTDECSKKGIKLVHVFEDEWNNKKSVVKNRIRHLLGASSIKVYARRCTVSEISYELAEKFCNKYHIQGACPSCVNIGLFYKGRIVAVMTFGKARFTKRYSWELLRYCTLGNVSVTGGAGKLLAHFRRYNTGSIITYADRRWSDGNLYKQLGMTYIGVSAPSYYYVKNGVRFNRVQFQKHKLSLTLENFDASKSERANMLDNGYTQIYDCGCYKFTLP